MTDPESLELQRQAALGRLLASVVHEMSAPLASMLSNRDVELRLLDRIEREAATAGDVKELVAACREMVRIDQIAGERINRLIRSVKIAARASDPKPQRVQINKIVESTLDLIRTEFRERIRIETQLGPLPEVECLPHLLSQAILSLVTNAGQAIQGTGTVTVGTSREGESIHIWITDTGPGIRPEDRCKVLKSSFTTKPLGVGTGLGLLIVRRIVVEEHGGSIDFESEPGRGTTFHLRIPVGKYTSIEEKGVEPRA